MISDFCKCEPPVVQEHHAICPVCGKMWLQPPTEEERRLALAQAKAEDEAGGFPGVTGRRKPR